MHPVPVRCGHDAQEEVAARDVAGAHDQRCHARLDRPREPVRGVARKQVQQREGDEEEGDDDGPEYAGAREDTIILDHAPFYTTSPSALRRPPSRRSQMRSQCSAERFLPPVSGYERPRARWTVPPIFSSKRIVPVGRTMPKFVPMPTSPRKRDPSSVASARCRYSSPTAARAETTSPSRSRSSTPSTSTPAGAERTVKRTCPLALFSS